MNASWKFGLNGLKFIEKDKVKLYIVKLISKVTWKAVWSWSEISCFFSKYFKGLETAEMVFLQILALALWAEKLNISRRGSDEMLL